MSDFKLKDILVVLRDTFKGIAESVFITNRPKTLTVNYNSFIVISLPVMLYNKTFGRGFGMTTSYARIEIYVKDKDGLEQTAKLDDLVQKCIDKFPINKDFIIMSRPRVVMSGADDYGFHVATIQASFITK